MRILSLTALLTFVVTSSLFSATPDCKECNKPENLCGPNCLYYVCQKLEVGSSLDELVTLCQLDKRGTDMLRLSAAASAKGLKTRAVKISAEELAGGKVYAISQMRNNHFVVAKGKGSHQLDVMDAPTESGVLSVDEFNKYYMGYSLLVSKDESQFPTLDDSSPDARVSAYEWDFGSVYDGDIATTEVTLANKGKKSLVIASLSPSCTCIAASCQKTVIAPGESVDLHVAFDSAKMLGGQNKILDINTNDPVTPTVEFGVHGLVKSAHLAVWPRSLDFGRLRKQDQPRTLVLSVPIDPDSPCEVKAISCANPGVDATLSQATYAGRKAYQVSVTLKSGLPVGTLSDKIEISTTHPREPKTYVPIHAVIVAGTTLSDDSFFFGVVKTGSGRARTIALSDKGGSLRVGEVETDLKCISLSTTTGSKPGEYTIVAVLKDDAPKGAVQGYVTVHTNDPDQPEIKVPVYAYVQG